MRESASRWHGAAMIVGAAVSWGTMAVLAKVLLQNQIADPLVLVAVRSYLATLTLFLALTLVDRSQLRFSGACWPAALPVGVALVLNNYFYFQTIYLTTVATTVLLQYQAPILVALYTAFVLRQRLSVRLMLALGLALMGCGLVVRVYDPVAFRPNLLGIVTGLGTAGAFAFYILASRAALARLRPWTLLAYAYLTCGLVWLFVIPPWQILSAGYDARTWGAFLTFATLGTAVPYGLFINGLRFLPPTQASVLCMLEPVVAAAVATVVLQETLLLPQLLGGGLVLAAAVLAEGS